MLLACRWKLPLLGHTLRSVRFLGGTALVLVWICFCENKHARATKQAGANERLLALPKYQNWKGASGLLTCVSGNKIPWAEILHVYIGHEKKFRNRSCLAWSVFSNWGLSPSCPPAPSVATDLLPRLYVTAKRLVHWYFWWLLIWTNRWLDTAFGGCLTTRLVAWRTQLSVFARNNCNLEAMDFCTTPVGVCLYWKCQPLLWKQFAMSQLQLVGWLSLSGTC